MQTTRHVGHRKLLVLAAVAGAFIACSDDGPSSPDAREQTRLGAATPFGGGTARTFVTLDGAGEPTAIGVRISESAVDRPPAALASVVLPLPAGVPVPPFDHVTLDWNPGGHPPPGIYDRPHFDLHYYLVSQQERSTMTPADPQFAQKGARRPPAEHVPAGHVGIPGAVPMMGAHWADPTSPELNGQPFTITMSHGFYDGRLVFFEPMMTRAYLEGKPSLDAPLRVPQAYAHPGRYPTGHRVRWDAAAREYVIALTGLRAR